MMGKESESSNRDTRGVTNAAGEIEKGGCVMINGDGEYLLVMNRKRPDRWGLPKGHVEPNEIFEAAAVRETREETGYEVKVVKELPDLVYPHGTTGQPIRLHLWLAQTINQAVKPEEAGMVSEWVSLDEAKRRVFPNVAEYLDRIQLLLMVD